MSTRVLVADDTAVFRRAISEALTGMPGVEVVGTAANGRLALAQIEKLKPDLVTLDIEMPELNGIEVLQAMASAGHKTGVIVISSLTARGGELTVRALELGAFDFITKPQGGAQQSIELLRGSLLPIVRAFGRQHEIRSILRGSGSAPAARPLLQKQPRLQASDSPPARCSRRTGSPLVLIGVSTGGPAALARLLPSLPPDLGAPVFIVQHMPSVFTRSLAHSLASKCVLRVKEADDGEVAQANVAYVAPGGMQMKLAPGPHGEAVVHITDDPPENNCKPAVDYLFRSAALHFPGRSVAAILTGMGNDGTAGLRMLKRGGCHAIAQDESSCVVFGMPKEAILTGLVDTIAPLDAIAGAIVRSVREGCV